MFGFSFEEAVFFSDVEDFSNRLCTHSGLFSDFFRGDWVLVDDFLCYCRPHFVSLCSCHTVPIYTHAMIKSLVEYILNL